MPRVTTNLKVVGAAAPHGSALGGDALRKQLKIEICVGHVLIVGRKGISLQAGSSHVPSRKQD